MGLTCRSDYYGDTGRIQHPGDRSVLCRLTPDHEGDHDELIDGEPGHVTWPRRPVEPRTWTIPAEPESDVRAVSCACCGRRWVRVVRRDGSSVWGPDGAMLGARVWRSLVIDHTDIFYPLTDATHDT